MLDVNELRRGTTFEFENNLYKVIDFEHRKMARGGATIRLKVSNIRTGSKTEITFNSGSRVQDIRLDKRDFQYLYDEGDFFVFMDMDTFAQVNVPHAILEEHKGYLIDNLEVKLLDLNGEILDYELPITVDMEVLDAEMAVAGNTATGATKLVTLPTGLQVRTPLFVNVGDVIRIDTRSAEYITRVG